MKVRSPVLGYNHNVRYAGRLWHVQTEDSGVQNPHIFTHLFEGGTILATKRHDYDPTSDVSVVQKLMQTQHKAMLRDLKAGAFDEKISKFLGVPVVKEKAEEAPITEKTAEPSEPAMVVEFEADSESEAEVSGEHEQVPPAKAPPLIPEIEVAHAATVHALQISDELSRPRPLDGADEKFEEPSTDPSGIIPEELLREVDAPAAPLKTRDTDKNVTVPPADSRPRIAPPPARPGPQRPAPPVRAPGQNSRPNIPPPPVRPGSGVRPAVPQRPASLGAARRAEVSSPYGAKPTAEGVVVARPAVIVGGEVANRRAGGEQPRPPEPAVPRRPPGGTGLPPRNPSSRWHQPGPPVPAAAGGDKAPQDNIFGGDLISEKSLDEVILAYLSEDLNEK